MGDAEKKIIEKVKIYLKSLKELRIYRDDLIEEINDYSLKTVDLSAVHTENKTYDTTNILNKRISKKDRSISIINEINSILDDFYIITLNFLTKERHLLNVFTESQNYTDMISILESCKGY